MLAAVEEGVRLTAEAGIEALRAKSIAQTELLIALHDEWLAPLGFELGSPRDPARRGSHVALRHPEAWPICRALIERADVIPDFRGPDTSGSASRRSTRASSTSGTRSTACATSSSAASSASSTAPQGGSHES